MIVVIKCERCHRPFGSYAKRCPDCGWRSRFWMRSFLVRVVAAVAVAVALFVTYQMAQKQKQVERTMLKVQPTRDQGARPW
jgi:hypothetical protein